MWNGSPVPPPAGTTGNLWASLGLPPPASTPTTPVFTGFSVGSKKPPNRSAESKAKTAAKRSMTAKAVKVWEALKYHMDKGVDIMSDIDDIAGLHAYIGAAEGKADMVRRLVHENSMEISRNQRDYEEIQLDLQKDYQKDRKEWHHYMHKQEEKLYQREAELDQREAELDQRDEQQKEEDDDDDNDDDDDDDEGGDVGASEAVAVVDCSIQAVVAVADASTLTNLDCPKIQELYDLRRKVKEWTRGEGDRGEGDMDTTDME